MSLSSGNYTVIQGWMCNELNLKGNHLLVFALIFGFSKDGASEFSGGRKYIADTFNITQQTVTNVLHDLENMGYIEKTSSTDYIHTDKYRVSQEIVNAEGSKEILLGVVKKFDEGSQKILPNNINNNIELKDSTISTNVEIQHSDNVVSNSLHCNTIHPLVTESCPVKRKRKNLYEKCMDAIEEYTDDADIQEALKTYIKVLLECKDKTFGFNSFESALKKLKKLTNDKRECLQIIQYSTDGQYRSFFELKSTHSNYIQNGDVFSEYGKVHTGGKVGVLVNEQF